MAQHTSPILPVIDLMDGKVVRGVGGDRDHYVPIRSKLVDQPMPAAVAGAFAREFSFTDVYIADLNAIAGKPPNVSAYEQIASQGLGVWIDAGVGDGQSAERLLRWEHSDKITRVIAGLESLASPKDVSNVLRVVGDTRLTFSLDLFHNVPLCSGDSWGVRSPLQIASVTYDLGVRSIIVLDLSQVGSRAGNRTGELCQSLRKRYPDLEIISGGGVRNRHDVLAMQGHGCDRILVASALHDGGFDVTEQPLRD